MQWIFFFQLFYGCFWCFCLLFLFVIFCFGFINKEIIWSHTFVGRFVAFIVVVVDLASNMLPLQSSGFSKSFLQWFQWTLFLYWHLFVCVFFCGRGERMEEDPQWLLNEIVFFFFLLFFCPIVSFGDLDFIDIFFIFYLGFFFLLALSFFFFSIGNIFSIWNVEQSFTKQKKKIASLKPKGHGICCQRSWENVFCKECCLRPRSK